MIDLRKNQGSWLDKMMPLLTNMYMAKFQHNLEKDRVDYQLQKEKQVLDYRAKLETIEAQRESAAISAERSRVKDNPPKSVGSKKSRYFPGKNKGLGGWKLVEPPKPQTFSVGGKQYILENGKAKVIASGGETLKGKEFYWQEGSDGEWRKTPVPVGGVSMTKSSLTAAALKGDKDAKAILGKMREDAITQATGIATEQAKAKISIVDVNGVSDAIIEGRETIDNVRNTFGVAVQEAVRSEVMKKDPQFNFVEPRIRQKSIQSAAMQQEKQRSMAGSFVKNLDSQIGRVQSFIEKEIDRVGVRLMDLPIRELKVRAKGSGEEAIVAAYMIEISNEIGKLSTGSQASVRELSTEAQARWNKVHDPNLSFKELTKILSETSHMAKLRLRSMDDELNETYDMLKNVRTRRGRTEPIRKRLPGESIEDFLIRTGG